MNRTAFADYACFGHWALALQSNGYKQLAVAQANVYDMDDHKDSKDIHEANFQHVQWVNMAKTDSNMPYRPDMMVGSPPCIGMSGANPKAGPDHPANINFRRFWHDVAKVKPDDFIVEICEPVFTRGAALLAAGMNEVKKAGYDVIWSTFNVEDYGSPSIRRRPYFFGSRHLNRSSMDEAFAGLKPEKRTGCKDVLKDLEAEWDSARPDNVMLMSKYTVDGRRRMGPFRTLTDNRRVLDPTRPSPTVTGFLCESVFHYSRERLLAVPEIMRLMGFPDDFKFNPQNKRMNTVRYTKMIASGVQIDFTTKLLRRIKRFI